MNSMDLSIAGLGIKICGNLGDYSAYRFRKYISDSGREDVKVTYREQEVIETPDGEFTARNDYRVFLETKDKYINYDTLKSPEMNTALITADRDFRNVEAVLSDVESYGGASLGVRSFNMLGEIFKYVLIRQRGFVVHSSSLSYKGNGILFSAPSGTGKSTHTGLWEKVYKDDVKIINDDMPAVRKIDGVWHLCGTPWSGKSERNENEYVPLKAFVFLERGERNEITRIASEKAVFMILNQTLLPVYKDMMSEVMDNISDALKNVPCYLLRCTISEEAPVTVKEGVFNENQQ